ncbi:MAG TPA: amidohydrolase family protein [Terracidiphilus sp.]|jgi:L-fuconolactonase|nr:amidohydrolase family protein [Terracidiphilus sp.]
MTKLDAHQHFWKYSAAEYEWIDDSMATLQRDFLPADLQPLLATNGFDGSIVVQARQSLEETRWLLDLAAENDFIHGVVGWVDLCSPEIGKQLEHFAQNKKLVGVRHVVQGEPDDEFMLRPAFRRGIGLLHQFGLAYDLLIYPKHLPVAAKLVSEFPQQRFVLDHIAKPRIADGVLEPWARDIRELAKAPHVACKLSGMVTEAHWQKWKPVDFKPYLETVLETFGPDRLMIGSDWPVCTVSADYGMAMSLVKDFIGGLSASERDGVLGENCARAYELAERTRG